MKKSEIKRLIKKASDNFTPDVFPQIIAKRQNPVYENNPPLYENKKSVIGDKRRLMVGLACLFIVVAIGLGAFFGIMNQENETIYLEINPSLEITTNRFNRIKQVTYLNDDSQALFEGYNLDNMKVERVVELFLDLSDEQGYIQDNNQINIFVKESRKGAPSKTMEKLNNTARKRASQKNIQLDINVLAVSKDEIDEARNKEVSVGKIVAIRQIMEIDDSLDKQDR